MARVVGEQLEDQIAADELVQEEEALVIAPSVQLEPMREPTVKLLERGQPDERLGLRVRDLGDLGEELAHLDEHALVHARAVLQRIELGAHRGGGARQLDGVGRARGAAAQDCLRGARDRLPDAAEQSAPCGRCGRWLAHVHLHRRLEEQPTVAQRTVHRLGRGASSRRCTLLRERFVGDGFG